MGVDGGSGPAGAAAAFFMGLGGAKGPKPQLKEKARNQSDEDSTGSVEEMLCKDVAKDMMAHPESGYTFWDLEFVSAAMKKMKQSAATPDNVTRRITAEHKEKESGLRPNGTYRVQYSSENVFPKWISSRTDFAEMDTIIKDQHLSLALQRPPHVRTTHDIDLVTKFVQTNWRKSSELGLKRIQQIARAVTQFEAKAGQYILREGENSRCFYIIVAGEVDIHKKAANGVVATLGPGTSFGEIALEQGLTTASVIAKVPVELLVLYKSDYDVIMRDFKDCEQNEALKILKAVPMFKNWARSRLERVVQLLQRRRVPPGTVIVRQGDPPDNVYFIHEGICDVTKDIAVKATNCWPTGPHSWKRVTRLKTQPFKVLTLNRGGFFGEKAIVEDTVRAATVSAVTEVSLLMLDKVEFMTLLNQGHRMSDTYNKTGGYPSDEDILNLFNSLSMGTKTHSRANTDETVQSQLPRAASAPGGLARRSSLLRSPALGEATPSVGSSGSSVRGTRGRGTRASRQHQHHLLENAGAWDIQSPVDPQSRFRLRNSSQGKRVLQTNFTRPASMQDFKSNLKLGR